MTNPPKTPEGILAAMRDCVHSAIHGSSTNLLPDYHCSHKRGGAETLCRLYREPVCERRESFMGYDS